MTGASRKARASVPRARTHGSVWSQPFAGGELAGGFLSSRNARHAATIARARAGRIEARGRFAARPQVMTPGSCGGWPGAGGSTIEGEGSPGSVGSRGGSRRGGSREGGSRIGGPAGSGSRRGLGGLGSRTGEGEGVPREGGFGVVIVV